MGFSSHVAKKPFARPVDSPSPLSGLYPLLLQSPETQIFSDRGESLLAQTAGHLVPAKNSVQIENIAPTGSN
jgi:hypothetical protein